MGYAHNIEAFEKTRVTQPGTSFSLQAGTTLHAEAQSVKPRVETWKTRIRTIGQIGDSVHRIGVGSKL
jgi:hypothetical protein